MADPAFTGEFERMLREYAGVPSLLYDATKLSELAGARILLKREDLNHTGAHKIRNVLGQALLTKRMGKTRVIAETGAGQHGVATATACGLPRPRLRRLHGRGRHRAAGAQRRPDAAARRRGGPGEVRLAAPSRTRSTRRSATGSPASTTPHYLLRHRGRAAPVPGDGARLLPRHRRRGPRPVPRAAPARCPTRRSPASAAAPTRSACSPRSSTTPTCSCSASRPAATASTPSGTPRRSTPARSACCTAPAPTCCRTRTARPIESHSISAGLDYPGVGPSTPASPRPAGRRTGRSPTPRRWTRSRCSRRTEGIIPAIESAHAVAGALELAKELPGSTILVNLSGRGDKDMGTADRVVRPGRDPARRQAGQPAEPGEGSGNAAEPRHDREGLRHGEGGGPRRAGRLPAGRLPDVDGARRRDRRRWSTAAAT